MNREVIKVCARKGTNHQQEEARCYARNCMLLSIEFEMMNTTGLDVELVLKIRPDFGTQEGASTTELASALSDVIHQQVTHHSSCCCFWMFLLCVHCGCSWFGID